MVMETAVALVPADRAVVLPDLIYRAGPAAVFAAEEFFYGPLRNGYTRVAAALETVQFPCSGFAAAVSALFFPDASLSISDWIAASSL